MKALFHDTIITISVAQDMQLVTRHILTANCYVMFSLLLRPHTLTRTVFITISNNLSTFL